MLQEISISDLIVDINQGIATLTMNHLDAHNALSLGMQKMHAEFSNYHEFDDKVRVVDIKGAGVE